MSGGLGRNPLSAGGLASDARLLIFRPANRLRRRRAGVRVSADMANRGLGVLEWTGSLVPQGALVTGVKTGWQLAWRTLMRELAPQTRDGSYSRPTYTFRGRIGEGDFPAEAGRYVLFLGNACPWCHRVLLVLALRGLLDAVRVVRLTDDAERASRGGWVLDAPEPAFPGARDLRQVYDAASPAGYTGRCTAPLLVDAAARRIVSNESKDIVRMLNDAPLPGANGIDLVPAALAAHVDALNEEIYTQVNNGVYRAGFATSQAAYDTAAADVYAALARLDARLAGQRFLHGDRVTESDVLLYPTAARFDAVYATLFKLSARRLADFPHMAAWLRDMYCLTVDGSALQVRDTLDLDAARRSYFGQLFPLNPGGIVPSGPSASDLGLGAPAGRGPGGMQDVFFMRGVPALP